MAERLACLSALCLLKNLLSNSASCKLCTVDEHRGSLEPTKQGADSAPGLPGGKWSVDQPQGLGRQIVRYLSVMGKLGAGTSAVHALLRSPIAFPAAAQTQATAETEDH